MCGVDSCSYISHSWNKLTGLEQPYCINESGIQEEFITSSEGSTGLATQRGSSRGRQYLLAGSFTRAVKQSIYHHWPLQHDSVTMVGLLGLHWPLEQGFQEDWVKVTTAFSDLDLDTLEVTKHHFHGLVQEVTSPSSCKEIMTPPLNGKSVKKIGNHVLQRLRWFYQSAFSTMLADSLMCAHEPEETQALYTTGVQQMFERYIMNSFPRTKSRAWSRTWSQLTKECSKTWHVSACLTKGLYLVSR